jgi:hypothetical protein
VRYMTGRVAVLSNSLLCTANIAIEFVRSPETIMSKVT